MYLAADRVIVGTERFTAHEVAELSGVEEEYLVRVRRAMGLPIPEPDEALYTPAELESARMIHMPATAGISDEEVLELLRISAAGSARPAEKPAGAAAETGARAGHHRDELAQQYALAAERLYPLVNPLVENILALQPAPRDPEHGRERHGAPGRDAARLAGVGVCFADLVGFTRLGEELSPAARRPRQARPAFSSGSGSGASESMTRLRSS